ncbi:MAG: S8 family peptidase [Anaerovoracaceae bacterium]|jgi:subtilisin family serine protease
MKKRSVKICAAVCVTALVLQSGIITCFSESSEGTSSNAAADSSMSVYSAGGKVSSLNDTLDNSSKKTIYSIDDYEDNEIAVMYKDGSVACINCADKEELAEKLEELESDENVETYQPNFSYDKSDSATAEASSISGPVFYGAMGDSSRISNIIQHYSSANISSSHPVSPQDQYYTYQWGLNNNGTFGSYSENLYSTADVDVNAPEAWSKYKAKRDVTVAVVDTGADIYNSEISSSIWVNSDEYLNNGIDDDGNGYVDDYYGWNFYDNNNDIYSGSEDDHGTHCVGSIAAASNSTGVTGLASYDNIKVMPVKALGGANGMGTTLTVVKAIKYAEANGAKICNLSLGTELNDSLLYQTIKDSDMLFVVAAGNSESSSQSGWNIDYRPVYPAAYDLDNIIAVSNATPDGSLHYTSCYGSASVDLSAPGTDILGLVSGGQLEYMTGTSMAAPFVTAGAAMVYTNSYSLSLKETRYILIHSAKSLPNTASKTASGGMLDLSAALDWK